MLVDMTCLTSQWQDQKGWLSFARIASSIGVIDCAIVVTNRLPARAVLRNNINKQPTSSPIELDSPVGGLDSSVTESCAMVGPRSAAAAVPRQLAKKSHARLQKIKRTIDEHIPIPLLQNAQIQVGGATL